MNEYNGDEIKKVAKKQRNRAMSNRLGVLLVIVLLAFVGLSIRLIFITKNNNDEYQQIILSQHAYDSVSLAAKRGEIVDCNGTVLAASKEQYNVILDVKQMRNADENENTTIYQTTTVNTLADFFGVSAADINEYANSVTESRYYIVKKGVSRDEKSRFEMFTTKPDADDDSSLYNEHIKGVWFEKYYVRDYPQNTLACDVIGFSKSEGNASYGLEEYYNEELTGTNGRKYGYLSDDTTVEVTTIPATDGDSLVLSLDANIQMMVEKHLKEFMLEYQDNARPGLGANNVGCIIMRANTGEILAMGSYPNFDLNNPDDLSSAYSEEEIAAMVSEGTYTDACNKIWKNFCIQDTYEPGSVMKPFTVAMGLETGKLTGNETYVCNGYLQVGEYQIHCHNRQGDGVVSVKEAVAKSCNVALMTMVKSIGKQTFLDYQEIFNLGLKTNIDLTGEARTENLVFIDSTLGESELATASFGQGFNVSMIQMCAGYAALVNGGYYYEPHVVSKVLNSSGSVVKNIEPRMVKQVVSNSTSDMIVEYCNEVVRGKNTGRRARPAGYAIGGKTGTAETLPRGNKEYVVSFICHAPAYDPEIVCYVVIDRPNVAVQEDAAYANLLTKAILTDVLPYLNIPMTEEISESEMEELSSLELSVFTNREEEEEDPEDSIPEEEILENNGDESENQ